MGKGLTILLIIVIAIAGISTGCSTVENEETTITVSAASSMKDVLDELKEQFEVTHSGLNVVFNFGASGSLQHQIEQGAPVDLFISAGKKQISDLAGKGLVGKPFTVAGNQLVVVTPAGFGKKLTSLKEITGDKYTTIAIGSPETVPAGKYSEEALTKMDIMTQIKPRLVFAKDVRQVLTYVETGEADAGLVYMTDARISKKVDIIYIVPDDLHSPITYQAAVVKSSGNPEGAEYFLNFVESETAKPVFTKYGYTHP